MIIFLLSLFFYFTFSSTFYILGYYEGHEMISSVLSI